jgi:hypothetical protein
MSLVFALKVPTPEREAVLEHKGVCWPITTEATAYDLAKRTGAFGFWRLKERRL